MSKVAKRGILIVGILVAATVGIVLLEGPGFLLTWKYFSLLGAGVVAFLSQGILAPVEPTEKSREYPTEELKAMDRETRDLEAGELEAALEVFKQTNRPYLKLMPSRRPTGVFDCKFGGVPYLPPGFEYPHTADDTDRKTPLKLLCQLNFAKLPQLPGFPTGGILQFYIAYTADDDVFGADFDNPTRQDRWRVVYHRELIADESVLQSPPELTDEDGVFPFEGEFALEAEEGSMPISPNDYGWEDFMENVFEPSAIGWQLKGKYTEDEIDTALEERVHEPGHRIGGYPFFTQSDPRHYEKYCGYSVLLLQIDTDTDIMWGDAGVANFFITPEALRRGDFTDVLYNWDCF